jgi:hypothetical protein
MSTSESETRARTMGWLPLEKFEGPKERWVDAETYLKRGEEFLPILKANNRKLADQVNNLEQENRSTKEQLKAASEAINELKKFRSTLNKEKAIEQKKEITSAIVQARKDGDLDAEVELTEKLGDVTAAIKEADKAPALPTPPAAELSAAAKEWMGENKWFGTDQRRTGLAMGLANEWKAEGKALGTKEFFDHVDKEIAKVFDPNASRRESPSKVDGGGSTSHERGGGGRTFADLPPEAQAACKKFATRLVGPGRAYKNLTEWQTAYCATYDWS